MTSDRTAIFGGVLILIGGLALAFYASTNGEALAQSKAKIVTKYISLSNKALSEGDNHQAEKFVIKAIETDPKNKLAIAAFKKVEIAAYAPMPGALPAGNQNNVTSPKAGEVKQPQKPVPKEDQEDEMGCI